MVVLSNAVQRLRLKVLLVPGNSIALSCTVSCWVMAVAHEGLEANLCCLVRFHVSLQQTCEVLSFIPTIMYTATHTCGPFR